MRTRQLRRLVTRAKAVTRSHRPLRMRSARRQGRSHGKPSSTNCLRNRTHWRDDMRIVTTTIDEDGNQVFLSNAADVFGDVGPYDTLRGSHVTPVSLPLRVAFKT